MLGLEFQLRLATPCWGIWLCVCSCARSACTPPLLAGVCGVGVCAWARVLAALRHSWLRCWAVCICVRAPLVPRHSWLGFVVFGLGVAWHLCLCRSSLRVVRPARVCRTGWPLLLGTCPCALVVAGCVPLQRASWPCVGAPRLVRSGRSRCSGRLSRRRGAFPHPRGLRPRFYWAAAGARGGRPRTGLFVPTAGPRRGRGAGLAPRRTRLGPRDGVVPGGFLRRRSWAACAAVVFVCGPGH